MDQFRQDCLKAHNEKRAKHGSAPLTLNGELSKKAQQWAEHIAAQNQLSHSECMLNGERLGENVATRWASNGYDYTGEAVVDQWYSEISKHDFGSESVRGSGHFTQVVWKGSKELGVGKATSPNGGSYVVCNYRPAGNLLMKGKNSVQENVSKPL